MMPERASRTFICSVLFLDIVEYSRKPVAEQIRLKDRFNTMIAAAIHEIPAADRIILDTGDGVAINFLGDPEDALFVAMSLRDAFAPDIDKPPEVPARIGINLGPVRLVRDLNAQPNIIGDGINVAQRVMAFAKAGQILVSRSYYEIVSHISEGYTKLFSYEGSRTDKHVREHEIYSVGYSTATEAISSPAQRAHRVKQVQRVAHSDLDRAASSNPATARLLHHFERWLGNRSLAYGTAAFSSVTFLLALLTSFLGETPQPHEQTRAAPASKKLASTATTVTKIGTVSDSEPVLTTSEAQKQNTAQSDAADTAQEQPVPPPRKMKLRLPFFRTESDEEPAEIPAEQASPEQAQGDTPAEESAPGAADAAEETRAVTEFTADQPSMSASIVAAPLQSGYAERATVTLAISPWGEVYIDGKRIGVSPPVNEVEVLPGRRVIEIRNGDFPPYTQQVELRARQKIKVRYKFN